MLHLLQVFVQNILSVFRRMLQPFFIWMLHHVSHICCNSVFQLFQSYVAASGFMLQVAILDVSCVSRICCKCMFQIFHLCLDVCSIQIFFMLKCFMLFGWRRAEGKRSGALRSGHARPQSAPKCRSRGERGGGQELQTGT
jgi:hypothetical protein